MTRGRRTHPRPIPAPTKLVSVNPRYTQMRETYDSVEEFLKMCRACFKSEPVLTPRGGALVDETGEVVLVGA